MITNELRHLADLIQKNSVVVLHVGLSGLYDSSKSYKNQALTLLDEIRAQLAPKEIYVPTFTYNFTKSKIFDVRSTPAEVGRFSEEIRSDPVLGIKRSLDPVFSIVETEVGSLGENGLISNAFGEKSIWHYLDETYHYILNINLPTSIVSTQLHHFEYINHVPYRYKKTFDGDVVDWDGERG
jgi:aminoglycoside 3-N-acetyltransferase